MNISGFAGLGELVESEKKLTVVITGGGTGGHLFPGIAVAQEIISRCPDAEIVFIGTGRHVDQNAMKQYGLSFRSIKCSGLKGGSIWKKIKTLASLPFSLAEAMAVLKQIKPSLVFGVGGYVTGPVVLGAKLLGIPACIHEQNSVPGMANRKLGSLADRIFISIPGSEAYFQRSKCILSGNPLRQEILNLVAKPGHSAKGTNLLVLGGSQGAHRINTLLPEALIEVRDRLPSDFKVVHQTGVSDQKKVEETYLQAGIKAEVKDFFKDMASIYEQASLVVSRAGATTLAELTALKKPAILIPFPFAADDHQRKNGEFLVRAGAAKMYLEQEIEAKAMGSAISSLVADNEHLQQMGKRSGELAKIDASSIIVTECLKLLQ